MPKVKNVTSIWDRIYNLIMPTSYDINKRSEKTDKIFELLKEYSDRKAKRKNEVILKQLYLIRETLRADEYRELSTDEFNCLLLQIHHINNELIIKLEYENFERDTFAEPGYGASDRELGIISNGK